MENKYNEKFIKAGKSSEDEVNDEVFNTFTEDESEDKPEETMDRDAETEEGPEQNSVLPEGMVFNKLKGPCLIPEQQATVDAGIHLDQWHLGCD